MLPEKNIPQSADHPASSKAEQEEADCHEEVKFTQVPNAHAAGMGTMGRNDEKLPSGSDDGDEQPGPAY